LVYLYLQTIQIFKIKCFYNYAVKKKISIILPKKRNRLVTREREIRTERYRDGERGKKIGDKEAERERERTAASTSFLCVELASSLALGLHTAPPPPPPFHNSVTKSAKRKCVECCSYTGFMRILLTFSIQSLLLCHSTIVYSPSTLSHRFL
jgi:hypothetical protein